MSFNPTRRSPCLAKETSTSPASEKNITWTIEYIVAGFSFTRNAFFDFTFFLFLLTNSLYLKEAVFKKQETINLIKESGNREAVYMTNNPLLAEFTALTGGRVKKRKAGKMCVIWKQTMELYLA